MKAFDKKFGEAFVDALPTTPGVYRFIDDKGEVIYVGKAKNLRRRLSQYRNPKRLKRHAKMRRIVKESHAIQFDVYPDELTSLLQEMDLIQTLRPKWNVAGAFSFLYPMIGIREENQEIHLVLSTMPEELPHYEWFGAYRSRRLAGDAFFALMSLFSFVGHVSKKQKHLNRHTYLYIFRKMEGKWLPLIKNLLKGSDCEFLEEITFALLEKLSARAKAEKVEEDLKAVRRFYRHEAAPLARALAFDGYASYPITQKERDPLFIRYKVKRSQRKLEKSS